MSEAQKASIVQNAGMNMAQPTVQPWVTPQATQPVSNPVSPVQMPQNYGLLAQQNYQTGQNSVPNQMRSFYQQPAYNPNQFAQTIQAQNQFAQQLRDMANAPVKPMFKPVVNPVLPNTQTNDEYIVYAPGYSG
jgi:hypothetical protein